MDYGTRLRAEDVWFEELREYARPLSAAESPVESVTDVALSPEDLAEMTTTAHDAVDIDTPTLMAYFRGQATPDQCATIEAAALTSPTFRRKLTALGAVVAEELDE